MKKNTFASQNGDVQIAKPILYLAISYGNDEDRALANRILIDAVVKTNYPIIHQYETDGYLKRAVEAHPSDPRQLNENSLKNLQIIFQRLGIPLGGMLLSWRDSHASIPYVEFVCLNLKRMLDLENDAPGSVAYLTLERGICAYNRYSKQLLAEQYRNRDAHKTASRAPVIIVVGQFDYDYQSDSSFKNCNGLVKSTYKPFGALSDPPPMILMEANNALRLLRRLDVIADNLHSNVTGRTTIIINAHSYSRGMALSYAPKASQRREIHVRGVRKIHRHPHRHRIPRFKNGVVTILAGCSAGEQKGSIANSFSPFGDVFAPAEPISGTLKIEFVDTPSGAVIQDVAMSTYDKSGKEISVLVRRFKMDRKRVIT